MRITLTIPETTVLAELGQRAQQYRIGMNLTQVELARHAGVSRSTIERLEAGSSVQLEKLLRILRALRLSDNLDQLIPEAGIRPIQLVDSKVDTRQRASKPRRGSAKAQAWTWGDNAGNKA